jgi:Beta propeller domain
MAVEIPSGDKEALPLPSEQPQDKSSSPVFSQTRRNHYKKKPVILTGIFVLFVVAAVLVGVLPDWKDTRSTKKSSNNNNIDKEQQYLELANGTFDVTLPLFSKRVTDGYSNQDELKNDLKEVAKFLLNDAIKNNIDIVYNNSNNSTVDGNYQEGGDIPKGESSVQNDGSGSTDNLAGVDAYETNNQEFTIDRADFVKSDGNFLYAAYSDHLVVFTTDGQGIISQTKMTPLNVTATNGCGWGGWGCIEPMPEVKPATENGTVVSDSVRSSVAWPGWTPKARIEAILLHGTRLTAVVSGYGMEYAQKLGRTSAIYEYLSTRIQVYDINSGNLQLVSEKDVNGYFMNAYSKGEFVHIVTRSSVNTWDHLLAPLDRSQVAFQGLDDTQYVQEVTRLVDEGLVDKFVEELIAELEVSGPVDLARLSFFIDSIAADNSDQDLYYSGLATSISQVVSFDMTSPSSTTAIQPHLAATFHPGSWGHVYAMGSMIIVADIGWSWIAEENQSYDKTYLICFSLSGASSSHSLVGTVEGSLLNPFSIDYVEKSSGSYVRVATTQNSWTPWIGIMEGDVAVSTSEAVDPVSDTATTAPESSTLNQIIILKVPSEATGELERVGSVELGEPNEVSVY